MNDLPDTCTWTEPCLHWFPGMGYRPAIWSVQRDMYGDRLVLIVGDDRSYESKYEHRASEELIAALRFGGGFSTGGGASGSWEAPPAPAPVPLPSSGLAMLAVLFAVAILSIQSKRRASL